MKRFALAKSEKLLQQAEAKWVSRKKFESGATLARA